ncbi:MAG: hypothetical protein RLZZ416_559 [Candidatus Parcubacteria bacterium]|jgi:adenosine kinase
MSKIIVSGSIAYDRIMDYAGNFTDSLVADKLHALSVSFQVERIKEEFGGCAGNLAYNLLLLGEQPSIIATAGSDFGRYADYLEQKGIRTSSIRIDRGDLTSVAHIVTDQANNQIAAFALASGGKPYGELPETKGVACAILGAGCVADTEALAAHAKGNSLIYYVDPGQAIPMLSADALCATIAGSAGLFANDYEIGMIESKTGWKEQELLEKTSFVVITLGAKGSRVLTKEKTIEIRAVPVGDVVDPTGAGDAHRAGFVKGILSGFSLEQSGKLASAVAAYAVEKKGTQNHFFTRDELKARYEAAYGEQIGL